MKTRFFVLIISIILLTIMIPNNVYAQSNSTFERALAGSTGWSICNQYMKSQPSSSSTTVCSVEAGKSFCILSEVGNYWCVKYKDYIGFIEHTYCFINLPDILPSAEYDITNSYSSIYKVNNEDIPGLTGEHLYAYKSSFNDKLNKEEFIVPMLYSTAKLVVQAQYIANDYGYSLKIYDTYRPNTVTQYASEKLEDLYDSNSNIRASFNGWGLSWFLAKGTSTHNTGAALDVSLVNLETGEEANMPSNMHELSVASVKYTSGGSTSYTETMTEDAILLDQIFTEVGMKGIASEWWHFQDNDGYNKVLSKAGACSFQILDSVSIKEYQAYYYLSSAYKKNIEADVNNTTISDITTDTNEEILDEADLTETYRLFVPENPESKPLMIFIPGAGGGLNCSYYMTGLYQYLTEGTIQPNCTVVFFYRKSGNGKISADYVKEVVDSIPHTELYYCGFSLGAWTFSNYLDVGDFTKAILIDGYDVNFITELSLQEVYVVQAYENYIDQYNEALSTMQSINPNLTYQIIDLTEHPSHVECGWWLFAPTDDDYYRFKTIDFGYPTFDIMSKL